MKKTYLKNSNGKLNEKNNLKRTVKKQGCNALRSVSESLRRNNRPSTKQTKSEIKRRKRRERPHNQAIMQSETKIYPLS